MSLDYGMMLNVEPQSKNRTPTLLSRYSRDDVKTREMASAEELLQR